MKLMLKAGILLTVLAVPVIADQCSTGSLMSVEDTTCNIGALTFQFGQVVTNASTYYNATDSLSAPLSAADFGFTPLSSVLSAFGQPATGFSITALGGPDSMSAPTGGYLVAQIAMDFSVMPQASDTNGATVSGGSIYLSAYGNSSANLLAPANRASMGYECDSLSTGISAGEPACSGSILLQLYASNGGSVEWDKLTVTFSLATPAVEDPLFASAVPEPASLIGLTTILGLCGLLIGRGGKAGAAFAVAKTGGPCRI